MSKRCRLPDQPAGSKSWDLAENDGFSSWMSTWIFMPPNAVVKNVHNLPSGKLT